MNAEREYYVYFIVNRKRAAIYTGMTGDLLGRTYTHRSDLVEGFTRRYGIHRLVYFERHGTPDSAIQREKRLKKWNRDWKVELIERDNPRWDDLWWKIIEGGPG